MGFMHCTVALDGWQGLLICLDK